MTSCRDSETREPYFFSRSRTRPKIEPEKTAVPPAIKGPAQACRPKRGCIETAKRARPLKIA